MDSARDYLNDSDRFGRLLEGYRPREAQLLMADAVAKAIDERGTLLVEAETGTGKTLAYLLPALLSEGPTLVSTGTKSLQDQLFFKDLPVVLKALGLPRKTALLKGRANYLCPYRLELHQQEARFLTRETAEQLQIVAHWAALGHQHRRQLPGHGMPEIQRMPVDERPPRGPGGGSGGGQPPPVFRGRGPAWRGRVRVAAARQHGDLR